MNNFGDRVSSVIPFFVHIDGAMVDSYVGGLLRWWKRSDSSASMTMELQLGCPRRMSALNLSVGWYRIVRAKVYADTGAGNCAKQVIYC